MLTDLIRLNPLSSNSAPLRRFNAAVLLTATLMGTACSDIQPRSQVIIPASLGKINTNCGPRVPFDLCQDVAQVIEQSSRAEKKSDQEYSGSSLLVTDYKIKEKSVSVNRDASTAQYRLTATATLQFRHENKLLFERKLSKKSTYHNDTDNVLGKNREKQKMLRFLNTLIAKDIPYLIAPYTQIRINAQRTDSP